MSSPTPLPIRTERRTLSGVFRPYRMRFLIGTVWLLCTTGMSLWIPRLLNQGVEGLRQGISTDDMLGVAGMLAGAAVIMAITRVWSRTFIFNVGRDVEYDLRRDLYAHLCVQPAQFYEGHPVGDLMSRATNDLQNVRLLFGFAILNVVNTAVIYFGNIPILMRLDWKLALATLAPYPIVFMAARVVARSVFTFTKQNQEDLGRVSSRVQEHLSGLSVVRAFSQQQAEVQRFSVVNEAYYGSSVRLALVRNLLAPVMGLLGTGSALIALWYGAHRVLAGAISVGDLVEFNARLAALAWPTLALGWIMAVWQRGMASLERINEILTAQPAITSPTTPAEPREQAGAIKLEEVGLQRSSQTATGPVTRWTLQDLNVNLPARGFLGVVGGTGSGKTTFTLLLPRLIDPTSGTVKVDGVDVKERDIVGLRAQVAIAPQEAFLFSVSVLENLRFGRPEATMEDVQKVVDLLALGPDVQAFPNGLDTVVGERGITLSGGQRQRVALGRAILCDPQILILDDTVSAVDAETEERILTALRGEAHRRTLVVTSHRLSAVKDADEVIVLDAAKIVERGTHEELLRLGGIYAGLWGRERAQRELDRLDHDVEQRP